LVFTLVDARKKIPLKTVSTRSLSINTFSAFQSTLLHDRLALTTEQNEAKNV
jgi:hypothetical protein